MNRNIIDGNNIVLKKMMNAMLLMFTTILIPLILSSCEIDDSLPSGGSGSGSSNSSKFVGTWSRQVQWAATDGTREESYTLNSGGKGTYKSWDWLDQKYWSTSLTWTSYGDYVVISRKDTPDAHLPEVTGYINSSGNALKIDGYWYSK